MNKDEEEFNDWFKKRYPAFYNYTFSSEMPVAREAWMAARGIDKDEQEFEAFWLKHTDGGAFDSTYKYAYRAGWMASRKS
jgi:hypothetical protein